MVLGSGFQPKNQNVNQKAVWVRLSNLPHHFSVDAILQGIGNFIGSILAIDRSSKTLAYARLYVLVDVNASLPSSIDISSRIWGL